MAVLRTPLLWAVAGALIASTSWAGNVYVQVQCGNPPEIAETAHSVELHGEFSPDYDESPWLVPLAGRVDGLRLDGKATTVTRGEIERGFIETEELGRIYLMASDHASGYGAIVLPETLDGLEDQGP